MESPVRLSAILRRTSMPVAAIRALRVGDTLPVPSRAVRSVSIEDLDGRVIAIGRLGMTGGLKAIRLRAIGDAAAQAPDTEEDLPATAGAIDLDGLGLGDFPDPTPPSALTSPTLHEPVFTPDDLPDLGDGVPGARDARRSDGPPVDTAREIGAPTMGLGLDGTIPLDDLPELDGDLPPLDIKPMTVDIE